MNFKKLRQTVNLREDWSGVLLLIIPKFVCVCLQDSEGFGWITARIIFCLGEGEDKLVATSIDSL